jgi:hypothetical protein
MNCPRTIAVLALSLFIIDLAPMPAQTSAPPRPPRDVLEAYRKMDEQGGRLTAAGWYRASKFFVKPSRTPRRYVLEVIAGERIWDRPSPQGSNRVRIDADCDALGQIDSSGRFTSVLDPVLIDPTGRPVTRPIHARLYGPVPIAQIYYLVRTDTHWEFGPNREGLKEVKGPPEWRIETFEFEPVVTIETAIRYLTKLRDESSSEVIKRNADKSIATLRHLD